MSASLFFTLAKELYGLISDKKKADATYERLVPALKFIMKEKERDSKEAQGLFEILEALPPSGIKRENFKKEYIDDPDGWKELPDDPRQLPFGYWH